MKMSSEEPTLPGQVGAASFSACLLEVPVDLPPASGHQPSLLALTSGRNQPYPQSRTQPSRVLGFVLLSVCELGRGWTLSSHCTEAQN